MIILWLLCLPTGIRDRPTDSGNFGVIRDEEPTFVRIRRAPRAAAIAETPPSADASAISGARATNLDGRW